MCRFLSINCFIILGVLEVKILSSKHLWVVDHVYEHSFTKTRAS